MGLKEDKWVQIMCDFGADPVWDREGAPAELADLPVSQSLRERLRSWQEWYEREADAIDGRSNFDVASFALEGHALAREVKLALPNWTIVYLDEARLKAAIAKGNSPESTYKFEV